MDTTSLHCKHPKKMKSSTDSGNHEVFVLSPDILKKLGISIANINGNQVISTDAHNSPTTENISHDYNENVPVPNYSHTPSDTSILETASLMKKSVFLSPTFVPTLANVIPGEVEILTKEKTVGSIAVAEMAREQSSIFVPVDSNEVTDVLETKDAQEASHKVDQANLSYNIAMNKEYTSGFTIYNQYPLTSPDGSETEVVNYNNKKYEKVETRLNNILYDENSSKSNSSAKFTVDTVSSNNADNDNIVPKSSKINIISEETIPLSKLRELKRLQSSNIKEITAIPVNSIIHSKIKKDNNDSGEQSTRKTLPTESLKHTKFRLSESNVVDSEDNTNKSNVKCVHINLQSNVLPCDISSNGAEVTSSEESDIVSNIIDNANITDNKQSYVDTDPLIIMEHSLRGSEITLNKKTSDKESEIYSKNNAYKATGDRKLNKNKIISEDNISVNVVTVNGFDKHDVEPVGIDVDKCIKNYTYDISQIDTESKNLVNQYCAENEQEYNDDNAEKSSAVNETGIDKNSITETNLKQNFDSKSACKQVDHSKSNDNNISLKNIEDKKLKNDDLANILNATKEMPTNNTSMKVDKVKEIAAYLKKFSHMYTDKNKIKKDCGNNNNKRENNNSNANTIESKLCIQGVEKPGGYDVKKEHTGVCEVIKTYTRLCPTKQSKLPTKLLPKNETCNTVTVNESENELNTDNVSKSFEMQEFCLCYDFGRIAYYDYDNLNEHIHFWQHNTTNCELDLIFAIYNDGAIINNESGLEQEQKTEEKVEAYNVCWNVYRNDFPENVDTSDPEQIRRDYVVDELKDASLPDSPLAPQLNIVTEKGNVSKSRDKAHKIISNPNSDIILETGYYGMVDTDESKNCGGINNIQNVDKLLNAEHNDNVSSVVVTTADIYNINTNLSALETKLTVCVEDSDAKKGNASNTKGDTNKRSHHNEPDSNAKKSSKQEVHLDLSKTIEKNALKRSFSGKSLNNEKDEPSVKKNMKCGLCNNLFSEMDWEDHVTNQHNLIAWKAGSSINLEDRDLLEKVKKRLKTFGELQCSICNMKTKRFTKFIEHVQNCIQLKFPEKKTGNHTRKSRTSLDEDITCGVCQRTVKSSSWLEHIGRNHDYLAWIHGQEALDLEDESMIWKHLQNVIRLKGSLKCYKCGLNRSRAKLYLAHVKTCDSSGTFLDEPTNADLNSTSILEDGTREGRSNEVTSIKCGVCKQDVTDFKWIEHICKEHKYLAWQDGDAPLDLEDEEAVWNHLQQFIRQKGGLTCYKCGLNRKRVKLYLSHVETCDGTSTFMDKSTNGDLNSTSILKDGTREGQSNEVTSIKCGVCKQDVTNLKWIEHICKEHKYLAWQDGDTPLDLEDEEAVWNHLQQFIRQNGGLTCYKCGLNRKRVKLYLSHVETCDGTSSQGDISLKKQSYNVSLDSTTNQTDIFFEVPILSDEKKMVKCGVCSQEVLIAEWIQHIGKEHDYLAWQDGSTPLDMDDESALRVHLLDISRLIGGLTCSKCNKKIKYPKLFLQHLTDCAGIDNLPIDDSVNDFSTTLCIEDIKTESVTCGVCSEKVDTASWMIHLQNVHQYLAWIDGQPPLDFEDAAIIHKHLYDISRMLGGLLCVKCGLRRKYVKTYLHHIKSCQGKVTTGELSFEMMNEDILECAICGKKVSPKGWQDHAMKEHYNIAWVVGDVPIELNNPYAVEVYLKEYHQRTHKLVCKVCGISRVSFVGFYAHIITCGKTEKETEMYKSVCDICHNKYLIIYKSQHMTMHREQEYALERKLLAAKEKELKKEEPVVEVIQGGRRKAAEKAKTVIEKYKDSLQEGSYHCSKCGFNSEIEKELSDHICVEDKWGDASDSDDSVKLENYSDGEDSDETDIDSNVSDEERKSCEDQASHKKKRHSDSTSAASKITRLPYQIHSISTYMKKSTEEFSETYFTDEDIFPQWHSCENEEVPESEVVKYMPPIDESCKVRFNENQDWLTFKRFESDRVNDTMVIFVGASIQCMRWAPAGAGTEEAGRRAQFVALAAHAHCDVPRHAWDATPSDRGLLQIWDCGNLNASKPKFVLGIVHDYGTVWAIDWCPSGARDAPDFAPDPNNMHRLGLLAAACSNGSAYIFLVPYPSSITKEDKLFYRLKPVVELRLTSNDNRKGYQATAIKWSPQKGHSYVVVGYADGTTAYYDLNGESPLLRTTENNITVFYPYHDELVQNSCIEDVDMFPSGAAAAARAGGVVCVGSAGGAGAGPLQSHVVAARVLFPPHWPAALLAGDDCLVNQSINELEWWGGGRRVGGMRAAAGCAWCGRVAAAAMPLLRLLRVHPCYNDVHKQVIGTIQMTPLTGKRKRQTDELAMIVEPITYSEAVKKYGVDFKRITTRDRTTQQKLSSMPRDAYPERFPLSDVTAMEFCPTYRHHHMLAVALHAGVVVIVSV